MSGDTGSRHDEAACVALPVMSCATPKHVQVMLGCVAPVMGLNEFPRRAAGDLTSSGPLNVTEENGPLQGLAC